MVFTDQTYERIELGSIPQRIISLVPSQSELLWDLGLQNNLTGITKFCIHPDEMFRKVERIGGTKKLDLEKIRALKPDLIIGNKEENEKEQIEELRKEFKVWMSDIYTIADALNMIMEVGKMTGKAEQAKAIVLDTAMGLDRTKNMFKGKRTLYLMWHDPLMIAGGKTFIHAIMEHTGLTNCAGENDRYPEITLEEIKKIGPEICLLSSEPFPFREQHINELGEKIKGPKFILADGEMFSWYGSRMRLLPFYLEELRKEIV
jgi:ABC-type Fe3+-hydroxamate transport system substrate-binding protein